MNARWIFCSLLLLSFAGCGKADNGLTETAALTSIAGEYSLASVGGAQLPCCSRDSAGTAITLLAGTLTLDALSPDNMVFVPSGVMTAQSCVHTVPSGAVMDTAGVVHMPDGSSYVMPKCGAPYTLRLTYRYVAPDGGTRSVTTSSSNRYVWGTDMGGHELLRVFSAPIGSDGQILFSESAVQLSVSPLSAGPLSEPPGPEYHFTRVR